LQEVDRIQEAFFLSSQKSTRRASLQLCIPQTTGLRVYFVVSGWKILGHGKTDNNLESPCILWHVNPLLNNDCIKNVRC
jgi:hypothetical protein